MTPFSFAKVSVRWAAMAELCLALPPQLRLLPASLNALFNRDGGSGDSNVWLLPFVAGVSFVVPLVLWACADRLARYLLPTGADLSPAPDYDEWQQAGLTCVGIWMLLRVCLALPGIVFSIGVNFALSAELVEVLFYLIVGIVFVLGWRIPGRLVVRPFRGA